MTYVEKFERLGFGMFVHFGLYSITGKGEWYRHIHNADPKVYNAQIAKFKVRKDWAKKLVATAKKAGCKY